MIKKMFNFLSTISAIVSVILVQSFIAITDSYYFNGYIVLIFLLMLLNPIANLFRLNKKRINNPLYHLIVIALTSYISASSISSLRIYNQFLFFDKDNSLAINNALGCFGERFLYIMIALILTLLIAFIFKKEKIKTDKDRSMIMLVLIFITSILPLLSNRIWSMNLINAGFNIAQIVFTIIIFFKLRNLNTSSELQKYYLILMLTSLVSLNPIALVLTGYIFIQLDTFGLHL
ncbi:MAG: hypothetical protein E7174_02230 [Firmicutes bacterium]|nr:hypothetical protein [Bacillota bacterium]